jgi:hypothetical protein
MAGTSWRLSVTFSPVAVLPTTALVVLTFAMDGLDFDDRFWPWAMALLGVYGLNAGLDLGGTATGYSGWLSGRTGAWIKLRWLLTGVLLNSLLLAVLPRFSSLFGLDTSTGGPGTVLPAGAVLGLCFYVGSRFEDVSFFFEKPESNDDPPPGRDSG